MNTGKTLFSQLMDFLPTHEFNRCVRRYRGNHRVRRFSCRDQFLCMAFAQLTFRESLRDIETCLKSIQHKLYHSGFRSTVARNTLARANEKRDWRIYADLAQVLIPRWIKQYLRIKAFYGTSINAVKTQVWIAVCVYLLVPFDKKELKIDRSMGEMLQIFSIGLFEKTPLLQAFTNKSITVSEGLRPNQLFLFNF